ncbi:hypothetical protein JY97_00760 [Alkalispirochaeta odontotermitis]|uniref:hypothetical protein n=1 Tax=Olavius algarvensis spirochete endosymbiont TaxID=260710 RepID=UPI00052E141F|nr:hypothetical protein [Olavius algarvensis spirochete endosymbiont]KGM44452.1 hypothetical protein JY97_00760 [Alkalispirochaeta odontotermitis]
MKSIRLFVFIYLLSSMGRVFAQSEVQEDYAVEVPESELDELLIAALDFAGKGLWAEAFLALDEAEKLDPTDSRIHSYRISFQELSAIDEAQRHWASGEVAEVELPNDETDGESPPNPKFTIDRGERDNEKDPADFRDNLRTDISLKLFALDPQSSELKNIWLTGNEFVFAALGLDARYWMPFLGKAGGFNLRSSGYSWPPGKPSDLFNSLDLGINFRGFVLESSSSRLEIGIDFGISLHTVKEVDTEYNSAFFFGFWVQDPVLYHLFNADSLERLVFKGELRIYSSATGGEVIDLIDYRVEGSWYFNHAYIGVRFEWWNLAVARGRTDMLSSSLFGGIRY